MAFKLHVHNLGGVHLYNQHGATKYIGVLVHLVDCFIDDRFWSTARVIEYNLAHDNQN